MRYVLAALLLSFASSAFAGRPACTGGVNWALWDRLLHGPPPHGDENCDGPRPQGDRESGASAGRAEPGRSDGESADARADESGAAKTD
jgi:hypothetical protein